MTINTLNLYKKQINFIFENIYKLNSLSSNLTKNQLSYLDIECKDIKTTILYNKKISSIEHYLNFINSIKNILDFKNDTLQRIYDILTDIKVKFIAINNVYNNYDIKIFIEELNHLKIDLLNHLNKRYLNGYYIFSGKYYNIKPFQYENGFLVYKGSNNDEEQKVSEDRFVKIYNSGSDLFSINVKKENFISKLENVISDLKDKNHKSKDKIRSFIESIKIIENKISEAQMINSLDVRNINELEEFNNNEKINIIENIQKISNVDMKSQLNNIVEINISKFNLEKAIKIFKKMQEISLV